MRGKSAPHRMRKNVRISIRVPSSGSFGPTFPSRGKALYVPTFPAQRISDNETAMMGQAEQYNARFSIRAVREYM